MNYHPGADQGGEEGEPQRRPQQKTLWAEVRKETGRGRNRFTIHDLLADERCTHAILDFCALRRWEQGGDLGKEDEEVGGVSYRVSPHFLFSPHLSLLLLFLRSL